MKQLITIESTAIGEDEEVVVQFLVTYGTETTVVQTADETFTIARDADTGLYSARREDGTAFLRDYDSVSSVVSNLMGYYAPRR